MRERLHRHFAQGEKGGRGVHGEVLTDIQMDAQRISEQRRGLVNVALDLIGYFFLKEGIATFDNGGPREVIASGKQIFKNIIYHQQQHENSIAYLDLTRVIPDRCHSHLGECWRG